jgi:uncharacterized protein with PIN domain
MSKISYFRFYGQLQDFLPERVSSQLLNYQYIGNPSIKDAIEAIGVPHTEVEAINVNNQSVQFEYKMQNEDRVEVFSRQELLTMPGLMPVKTPIPDTKRFILDVHLGKLARSLRMLGFDILYETDFEDRQIAEIAEKEQRIVLTRDLPLLKRKNITHGYWLRSQQPEEQLKEVIIQYNLLTQINPFVRCINCNGSIHPVAKEAILEQLEPNTEAYFHEFYQCSNCLRVYWKGTHYEKMEKIVEQIKKAH